MLLRLHKIERDSLRNINGRLISRRYGYIIVRRRLFRKPMYLRLLPGWYSCYSKGEPCKVEFTSCKSHATEFREDGETIGCLRKSTALKIIKAIKNNPDNFILN